MSVIDESEYHMMAARRQREQEKLILEEKRRTCPFRFVRCRGARLVSRYGQHREYRDMAALMGMLSDEEADAVDEIFCDSKAGNCYTVELKSPQNACTIFNHFQQALFRIWSGYNCLEIRCGGEVLIEDSGHWIFDLEDDEPA